MVSTRAITGSNFDGDKVRRWAQSFRGLLEPAAVMASPPTVSVSASTTSQVDGSKVNGAVSYAWNDAAIAVAGAGLTLDAQGGQGMHVTGINGVKTGSVNPFRVRFLTDAPKFEACLYEGQGSRMNVLVDGEIAHTEHKYSPIAFNNFRYLQYDFGANTDIWGFATETPTIVNGGSGHAVGDIITLIPSGVTGTGLTVRVRTVSSGVVTAVESLYRGAMDSNPGGLTQLQSATTGAGTGLQLTFAAYENRGSTRKMRRIELVWHGGLELKGIVVPSGYKIYADPVPTDMPKLCVVGDSIMAGTYLGYAGGHIGLRVAQMLGLYDQVMISAQGSTGWNQLSGNAAAWSHANRVQDFIDANADMCLFVGSQNDTSGATLTGKVTEVLNAIRAAHPKSYIVGIGPVVGSSAGVITLSESIRDGFLAADNQARTRYIENVSENWIPAGTNWITQGDANHMHQFGQDQWAKMAASRVADSLLDMVA